jgi:hypothetical protein
MDWLELIDSTIPKKSKIQENRIYNKYHNKYLYKNQKINNDIDYDMIIKNDMTKNSDMEILNEISLVSKFIKLKIIDYKNDYDKNIYSIILEYIDHIIWIKDCIKILAERNNQDITKEIKYEDKLQRNSYKFCEYGYDCKYAYNFKQKCFSQHYVYDLIYQDIMRLINHIRNDKIEKNIQDIKISINTITYVITHMNEEILEIKNKKPLHYKLYLTRKLNFQK